MIFNGIKPAIIVRKSKRIGKNVLNESISFLPLALYNGLNKLVGKSFTMDDLITTGIITAWTKLVNDFTSLRDIVQKAQIAKIMHPGINEATRFERLMKTKLSPLNIFRGLKKPIIKNLLTNMQTVGIYNKDGERVGTAYASFPKKFPKKK